MTKPTSKPVAPPSSDLPSATLHILGGFELRDDNDQLIELKARKSRQLLAYLAIPSGQARSREQLAALLWSDRQEEQARGSLRTALSGIRRAIGNDALIVEHDVIRLRSGYLDTDYENLKKLSANDTHISKLGDFYAGEFLYGQEHDSELFMNWLRGLRAECSSIALKVIEKNADRFSENGDDGSAIDLMRESLSLEPLKEQTHRTIMRLYAANGEKAMALAQFRTCKEALLYELDAGPDPETQALADSIAMRDVSVSQDLRRNFSLMPKSELPFPDGNANSIAVLPFVNMSADAEQNYFADGITEDIIIDLSDFDTLSVAAKSSSDTYRGVALLPLTISNELGVRYLLEGSVRKSADKVRISARLFDAVENRQIWAKRYDRELDDIFELQSEISSEIVSALQINLKLAGGDSSNAQNTNIAEAYQFYLHAKSLLKSDDRSSALLAESLLESAVAVDPDYALAYAELANCEARIVGYLALSGTELESALVKAKGNCAKALQINPALSEAYLAQGRILVVGKDFIEAKDSYRKALALNPKSAEALSRMAHYYVAVESNFEKAFTYAQKAYAIDPDRTCSGMLLTILNGLDKPEEMKLAASDILRTEKRRVASDPYNFDAVHLVAYASYLHGDMDEAIHWTKIAEAFDLDDRMFIYNLACLQSLLGLTDRALETLEGSLNMGNTPEELSYAKDVDPDLEFVRSDPKFDELFARYEN